MLEGVCDRWFEELVDEVNLHNFGNIISPKHKIEPGKLFLTKVIIPNGIARDNMVSTKTDDSPYSAAMNVCILPIDDARTLLLNVINNNGNAFISIFLSILLQYII